MSGTSIFREPIVDDIDSITDRIEACIKDAAFSISTMFCGKDRQTVVMKLFVDNQDGKEKYMIIYGKPEKSEGFDGGSDRHGLGEYGCLHEPVEKLALNNAIAKPDEVIIIQDALNDPMTQYMRSHVQKKNILSVAIVPIVIDEEVKYLMVFDLVPPFDKGYSVKHYNFLKEKKDGLENWQIPCAKIGQDTSYYNLILKQMDGLSHEVFNHLNMIGIAGVRLGKMFALMAEADKISPEELAALKKYTNIIATETKRGFSDVENYKAVSKNILPTNEKSEAIPVTEILDYFKDEKHFACASPNGISGYKINVIPSKCKTLFTHLTAYLESLNGYGHPTVVEAIKDGNFLKLFFTSDSLSDVGSLMHLFEHMTEIMNGWFEFKGKCCTIALPLYE